jgi:hemolysin activation/secretion protein
LKYLVGAIVGVFFYSIRYSVKSRFLVGTVVFEALVNSPNLQNPAANPPVIQQAELPAAAAPQVPVNTETTESSDTSDTISSTSNKLAKIAFVPLEQVSTANQIVTTQSFLKVANATSAAKLNEAAVPVLDASELNVAPAMNAPQLAQQPLTPGAQPNLPRTRTEVVEEQITDSTTFAVKTIDITGNTIFTTEELSVFTKPLEGKSITLSELRAAVDEITKFYVSKGYLSSRAILGNQEVVDGRVTIQVLEGTVEEIKVEGNRRIPSSYIIDRIKSGVGTPLKADVLEDRLRLLQLDSSFEKVEAALSPGSSAGKSLLTVRVKEAKQAFFGVTSDNYSPPVVGSERYGVFTGFRSSFAPGDQFFASYNRSTSGGANVLDFLYKVPVNAMDGSVQLRVSPSWNKITDKEIGSIFDIDGNSQLYELTYRQPLKRTFREEFALSGGFALQNGETTIDNIPGFDTDNKVRVLKFGQDYLKRDALGVWSAKSQFNLGLDIFDATDNTDPFADGQFFSWIGQLQRVQRFNANNVLIAQFDVQLSPDALLPSQQFIIGGGQSVRGFRQNARFGDNGIRFSLENRTVVARNGEGVATIQVAPFIDLGTVWNSGDNPIPSPDERFLAGAGLGLILQPVKGLNMRFDYAFPFREVAEKNDNLQDKAFYFSLSYQP